MAPANCAAGSPGRALVSRNEIRITPKSTGIAWATHMPMAEPRARMAQAPAGAKQRMSSCRWNQNS
jgi:hypothetical protein